MTAPAVRSVHPSVSRTPIPLDAKDLPTVCVLCSHNCGMRVDVEDGRIVAARADEHNAVTHGYVCNKGFRIANYAHHEQRVQEPLRRKEDGSFERVSWDDALADIAARLVAIREESGPRAIGLVGIGGQANHMDGPFGLSWLGAVGSKRWFNAFAQEKHQHFLVDHWLFDAAPTAFFHPDQANARHLMVMGSNPRISNRGHNANEYFKAFAADPGRRLVVVDPRETETSRQADRHIRVRPGTDAWFLLAVAATIAGGEGLALFRSGSRAQGDQAADDEGEAATLPDGGASIRSATIPAGFPIHVRLVRRSGKAITAGEAREIGLESRHRCNDRIDSPI